MLLFARNTAKMSMLQILKKVKAKSLISLQTAEKLEENNMSKTRKVKSQLHSGSLLVGIFLGGGFLWGYQE